MCVCVVRTDNNILMINCNFFVFRLFRVFRFVRLTAIKRVDIIRNCFAFESLSSKHSVHEYIVRYKLPNRFVFILLLLSHHHYTVVER